MKYLGTVTFQEVLFKTIYLPEYHSGVRYIYISSLYLLTIMIHLLTVVDYGGSTITIYNLTVIIIINHLGKWFRILLSEK